jgi:hypothetical protein
MNFYIRDPRDRPISPNLSDRLAILPATVFMPPGHPSQLKTDKRFL